MNRFGWKIATSTRIALVSSFAYIINNQEFCNCDSNLTAGDNKPSTEIAFQHQLPKSGCFIQGANTESSKWMISYDYKNRNPKWTYEFLTREGMNSKASSRKNSKFFSDDTVDDLGFKIRPNDYKNTGYDRGHMVPAADFAGNQDDFDSTFTMCNISPQNPQLNKGFWAKFEAWLRYLVQTQFEEMIIITGPIFAPVFMNGQWVYFQKTIGTFPRLITVPTHFFKVILGIRYQPTSSKNTQIQTQHIGAFLIPNTEVDINTPLEKFSVKVGQLQSLVGVQFFPENLVKSVDISVIDADYPRASDLASLLSQNQTSSQDSVSNQNKKLVNATIGHICKHLDCSKPLFYKKGAK